MGHKLKGVHHQSLQQSIEAFANTVNSIQTGTYVKRNVTKSVDGVQRPLTKEELLQDELKTARRHLTFMGECVEYIGKNI